MPTAVVFPGQGSQTPGAGSPWLDHPAWSVVEDAEAAAGRPLAHLLTTATADDLSPTRESQLSVLLASLVAWRALEPVLARPPVAVAGHSLGQVTALIAAGALAPADGVRLALDRAEACRDAQSDTPGAMVALLGADRTQAEAACAAAPCDAWVANVNGAGQFVIGCRPEAAGTITEAARAAGVRRTRRLPVDGAFHSPLMSAAAEALRTSPALGAFRRPALPVLSNRDGRPVTEPEHWAELTVGHLTEPVRWDAVVSQLGEMGVDRIIEVGPGTSLGGLIRRIAPDMTVASVASPHDLATEVAE